MTYNIRRPDEEKIESNQWKFRKTYLIELIKKHKPDILCIQEDHSSQINDIKKNFENFAAFGFYNEDIKSNIFGEANSILFNLNKFRLLEKKHFWLTYTPNTRSKFKEQSINYRTVTYVKLKINNKEIFVFNTHFDHLSYKIQKKEAESLVKIINKINPINYLICGDFNGDITSPQVKIMKDNFSLINIDVSNQKTVMDWSEIHPPRKCIDFIFSNLLKKNVKIDNSMYLAYNGEKRTPSDHLPIVCKLEI